MMASTIKEFIICPRIITFYVIQKSRVKTGTYKCWALSRGTDGLSMWLTPPERTCRTCARATSLFPWAGLKRKMNHRKDQKKEIHTTLSWLGVKEARFLLKGQERIGGIGKDVLRMHRYGAGWKQPRKDSSSWQSHKPQDCWRGLFQKKY